MNSSQRSGIESLSVGYLLVAFAISILISWMVDDWWLLIPIFMIEAGGFYLLLGVVLRPRQQQLHPRYRNAPYYVFWGGTLGVIGSLWLLNMQYPGNVPLLIVIFIIWLGAVAIGLSMTRIRKSPAVPQ